MAALTEHYTLPAPGFDAPVRLLVVVAPYYRAIADDGARHAVEKALEYMGLTGGTPLPWSILSLLLAPLGFVVSARLSERRPGSAAPRTNGPNGFARGAPTSARRRRRAAGKPEADAEGPPPGLEPGEPARDAAPGGPPHAREPPPAGCLCGVGRPPPPCPVARHAVALAL